jgi:DNA mismatch repair ATPase MutS
LRELLKDVEDASRISQKCLLGRGTIDDLVSIRNTIEAWETTRKLLLLERELESRQNNNTAESWGCLEQLLFRMTNLKALSDRIGLAVECEEATSKRVEEGEDGDSDTENIQSEADASKMPSFFGLDQRWIIKPQ